MKSNSNSGKAKAIALVALTLLVALLALPGTTYAQSMTGALSGSVVDESGGVIPGADVTVINQASKSVRRTVTNTDGFFVFASLPPATYTVQVALAGFTTCEATDIELRSVTAARCATGPQGRATASEIISVTARKSAITPLNSGEKSATLDLRSRSRTSRSWAERRRGAPPAAGHDASTGATTPRTARASTARSSASTATATAASRARSATTPPTAPATGPSTSSSTAPPAPTPAATARPRSTRTPSSWPGVQGPAVELRRRARQGPGHHERRQQGRRPRVPRHRLFVYLRDYRLNSNEWSRTRSAPSRRKNKFTYPGFNLGGPLIIPGTGFNKNRDKVFFFTGYEFFGQTLDTGIVQSWVPTADDAERRLPQRRRPRARATRSTRVPNIAGGIIPANLIDPDGQVLLNQFPRPNANPAPDRRLQLRRQPARRPERQQGLAARRLQRPRQHEASSCATTSSARRSTSPSACGGATASTRSPTRPRSTAPNRSHSVDGQPDPRLRPDADDRDDLRRHLHQLPEPDREPPRRSPARRSATPTRASTAAASTRSPR